MNLKDIQGIDLEKELQAFNEWEPQGYDKTIKPDAIARGWGERFTPWLANFHDAIGELGNPVTRKFDPDYELD